MNEAFFTRKLFLGRLINLLTIPVMSNIDLCAKMELKFILPLSENDKIIARIACSESLKYLKKENVILYITVSRKYFKKVVDNCISKIVS
jgi:hypothetical protein